MAADAESNIKISFDTSEALASLKALQREIADTQKTLQGVSANNAAQAQNLQRRLVQDINATGKFAARITDIQSSTEQFTTRLEKNKFSMGEYFRYGASQVVGFRNVFSKEFNTIEKVARERVKTLQTQYISLGRDASGALKAISVRPLKLDMNDLATQTAINAQKQQIFNQLLKQGSTNLLNFGKNTQWAGRQLMVGFTIPLSILGTTASKTFMEMEEQAIRFKRVYGELFTPPEETDQMLGTLTKLGEELTKYGIAVKDTLSLAADAAAMGKTGAELTAQVAEASRLAVLGGVQQQQALETTISLTNAFGISAENLANKVDFLNAVENQTVVSIEDLTTAIPKAGPVIKQLGGGVEDLAFFLTAMKEGGINASEGANALKSGLASLINPTGQASAMLQTFGINIRDLVKSNAGDVRGLVVDFAKALDQLNPQQRAQAIEQLFGKFQFARVSALFQNVIQEGTQASRVLELANATTADLAQLSAKELGRVEESTTYKFRGAIEEFKAALAPVGEEFMKLVTPIVEFGTKVLKAFDNMSGSAKGFVTTLVAILGGIAPVALMTFGLLANGVANIIKGFAAIRNVFLGVGQQTNFLGEEIGYMSDEQLRASSIAASLEQSHSRLEQRFTSEAAAVMALRDAYMKAAAAGNRLTGVKATGGSKPKKMKKGGVVIVPGSGKGDKVPAMLEPGEAVIPSEETKKYAGLINGMIADNIPGYKDGRNIQVAGGFEASHFGPELTLPIADAIQMLREFGKEGTQAFQNLIAAQKAGIEQVKAFNNQVVALPSSLNKALGQTGSGKSVVASTVKSDITSAMPGMHIELERQLKAQGLTEQEIIARVDRINKEITQSLAKFDDSMMMTAEDVNGVIEQAYKAAEKVNGKVDKAVKKANDAMKQITTVKDPVDRDNPIAGAGPGQDRVAVNAESYRNQRRRYVSVASRSGSMGEHGAFRATEGMLSALGVTHEQLAREVKSMTVAQQQSVATLAKAANASGDYSVLSEQIESIRAKSARRSKASAEQDAVTAKTEEQTSKKKKQTAKKNRDIANADSETTRAAAKSTRRRSPKVDVEQRTTASLTGLNTKVMAVTGALSTLTMVSGMFGNNLGGATEALATMSNSIFALSAIMQMLASTSKGQAMMQAGSDMMGKMNKKGGLTVAKNAKGNIIRNGVKGGKAGAVLNNLKNVVGAVSGPLGTLGKIALRAVPWIGGALLAFEAFKFVSGLIEEQKAKITGLGDAAFMTAEKMKTAGDILGFEVTGAAKFGAIGTEGTASASTGTQQQQIKELRGNEDFKSNFATEISALKAATGEQATAVLKSLALQMAASGAPKEAVDTFIKALAQEAGQTKLDLSFTSIDLTTADGLRSVTELANSAVASLNTAFETGFTPSSEVVGYLGTVYGNAAAYSEDLKKQAEITAGTISSTFTALNVGLNNGTISAEDFVAQMDSIRNDLSGLTPDQLGMIIPNIAKNMGLSETIKGLEDSKYAVTVLASAAAGIEIPAEDMKIFQQAAANPTNARMTSMAAKLQLKYNKALDEGVIAKHQEIAAAQEAAMINESIAAATVDLNNQTVALNEQTTAYNQLITMGYDTATAYQLAQNAVLATGIAAALAGDNITADLADIQAKIDAFLAAQKAAPKVPVTSGSTKKSDYQEAIEGLKQQRTEIQNTAIAYAKLRKAGYGVADASRIAADSTTAAALANSKIGPKNWKKLMAAIKETDAVIRNGAIYELLKELDNLTSSKQAQITVSSFLDTKGWTPEQIQEVLNNEDLTKELAADLEDGVVNSGKLLAVLGKIKNQSALDVQLSFTTKQGAEDQFGKIYDQATEYFSAKKNEVELKFKLDSAEDQKIIADAENQIATLQYSIDDYDAALTEIQDQEDKINEQYDTRIGALDKVQQANSKIAKQQKAQLSIADALSQGDIAAAARAVQEKREQDAQDAIDTQKESLEQARTNRLNALTAGNGLTRKQNEAEIKKLKDEIFKIEESTLEPARERVRLLTVEKDAANALIDAQIDKWNTLKNKIDLAKLTDDQVKALYEQADVITDMILNWDSITDKEATLTIYKKEVETPAAVADPVAAPTPAPSASEEPSSANSENPYTGSTTDGKTIADITAGEISTTKQDGNVAGVVSKASSADLVKAAKDTKAATAQATLMAAKTVGVVSSTNKLTTSADTAAKKITTSVVKTATALQKAGSLVGKTSSSAGEANKFANLAKTTSTSTTNKKLEKAGSLKNTTSSSAGEANKFANLAKTTSTSAKTTVNTTTLAGILKASGINKLSTGGMVKYMANGGLFKALGTDIVPAMLTPGEFVVRRPAVRSFGADRLKAINSGQNPSDSVYNYSVNVNAQSNANPEQIAKAVITQIKQIDSQRIRSNRY